VEAVRRRAWRRAALALSMLLACAAQAGAMPAKTAMAKVDDVLAQGARDGNVPAWAIAVATPAGWTRDCCTYARAIGVDAVLYQGEWTGKPQRVMVLNVWPRKLPTLAAELEADRKHYLQRDPAAKARSFAIPRAAMPCRATVYEGSDRIDDVVAFCDPGQASGIRLSWSMSFDDGDRVMRPLLDDFMRVVAASRYRRGPSSPQAAAH
jgi:hypothetical protein